jgi:phospholipase C
MLRIRTFALRGAVTLAIAVASVLPAAAATQSQTAARSTARGAATPIEHLVVITGENISFDHYFGTYPEAANTDGQPVHAAPGTPAVDGLPPATSSSLPPGLRHSVDLLTSNPNSAQPRRLDASPTGLPDDAGGQQTCDQDNHYGAEQAAFDGGKMDAFVQSTGTGGPGTSSNFGAPCQASLVMDYYDGNTVTALWNYAQHYAMSDNSYGTTFGGTGQGHLNLVSGDTGGVDLAHSAGKVTIATASKPDNQLTPDGQGGYALTNNVNPYWDDCSTKASVAMSGTNIGDELNAAGISWGYFKGGFRPTTTFAQATGGTQPTSEFIPQEFASSLFWKSAPHATTNEGLCNSWHAIGSALPGPAGQYGYLNDLSLNQVPFQFYASTANPHHLTVPTDAAGNDTIAGLATIGHDTQSYVTGTPQFDTPNHQYDMSDFDQLVAAITRGALPPAALPAVTFLKAPTYETGHAADSDPADEQQFVVREINALEQTPDWPHTAVILAYDDSDGWYDHAYSGITNPSLSVSDNLTNTVFGGSTSGQCGPKPQPGAPLGNEQGRCGFGPRLPLIVVSPWAKTNYVDHNLSDQASILNFIEYNWQLPGVGNSADQILAATDRTAGIPFDLAGMFDFKQQSKVPTFPLDPSTGQVNLSDASIDGQNLKGQNLSGADAAGASVRGTNLQGAFLASIDLANAELQGTNLRGADLAGANLSGARLHGVNLQSADLTGATLAGATLTGANVHGATWSNTTCPDGTNSNDDGDTCDGHTAVGHSARP